MKETKKIFFKTVRLSVIWMLVFAILLFGISESYTQIRKIGFAEYKNAVEYSNGVLRVLDFEFQPFKAFFKLSAFKHISE